MTDLLSALYLACASEDPTTSPSLSDYYKRTDRALAALQHIRMFDELAEYGEAMEEQGFINGVFYGAALAHLLL